MSSLRWSTLASLFCLASLAGCLDSDGTGGDPFPDVCSSRNACGGCTELSATPGDSCGDCGQWVCDGFEDVTCDDSGTDTCGGCGDQTPSFGDSCGTCGTGTITCDASGIVCSNDQGVAAQNACGGCEALSDEPGGSCGACGLGMYVCAGTETVICQLTPDQEAMCGDCAVHEGESCGACASGHIVCSDQGSSCADEDTSLLNACGGCGYLEGEPGTSCGPCGVDTYECDGSGNLVCNGNTMDDCGGCDFTYKAGDACGTCSQGKWACNAGYFYCDNDTADANACGGCSVLTGKPGDACGVCGLDHLVCNGSEALKCSGNTAKNTCGGCGVLAHTIGDSCDGDDADSCDDDTWQCQSGEAVSCSHGQDTCGLKQCPNSDVVIHNADDIQAFADSSCSTLRKLEINGDGIASLEGLEHLTTVGTLLISKVPNLKSLSGLDGFLGADVLSISDAPLLTDLHGLESVVHASSVSIGNLAGLGSLQGLGALSSGTVVTLSDLPLLATLDGMPTQTAVTALTLLNLPKLKDLKSLAGFTKLTMLNLGGPALLMPATSAGGALESLEGLEGLPSLISLAIEGQTKLKNLDTLSKTLIVQTLRVARNSALESLVRPDVANDAVPLNILLVVDCPVLERIELPAYKKSPQSLAVSLLPKLSTFKVGDVQEIRGVTRLESLALLSTLPIHPARLGGAFILTDLPALTDLNPLVDLVQLGGVLTLTDLPGVSSLAAFGNLNTINYDLTIKNVGTTDLNGFANVTSAGGAITLSQNAALTDVRGLAKLKSIKGNLTITDNAKLPTCRARMLADQLTASGALTGNAVISGNAVSNDCL